MSLFSLKPSAGPRPTTGGLMTSRFGSPMGAYSEKNYKVAILNYETILKEGFIQLIHSKFMIINLAIFFTPLFAVIFLHSVVYDSWRHLYFIYPSFLLIALYGFQKIISNCMRNSSILISAISKIAICIYPII